MRFASVQVSSDLELIKPAARLQGKHVESKPGRGGRRRRRRGFGVRRGATFRAGGTSGGDAGPARPKKLVQFERAIVARGGAAKGRATDVREEADVVAAFEETAAAYGRIDAAIYNAGAQHRRPMLEISGSTFEKVWRLACFGAFVFGREAVRRMLPHGTGTVIFTGATASLRGGPQFAAFASAKFGTRAIAQSMGAGIRAAGHPCGDGGGPMAGSTCRKSIGAYAAAGKTAPPDGLLASGGDRPRPIIRSTASTAAPGRWRRKFAHTAKPSKRRAGHVARPSTAARCAGRQRAARTPKRL